MLFSILLATALLVLLAIHYAARYAMVPNYSISIVNMTGRQLGFACLLYGKKVVAPVGSLHGPGGPTFGPMYSDN